MELKLDDQEAQVLLNLIDIAVKSQGLAAAEAGLHFMNKVKMAKLEADYIRQALEKAEQSGTTDKTVNEIHQKERGRRVNRDK